MRKWLKGQDEAERQAIGRDLQRAQWRWPAGMPLCRPMGGGLWEVRTDLPTKRTARVLLCLYRQHLIALHGFIKKTRAGRRQSWKIQSLTWSHWPWLRITARSSR